MRMFKPIETIKSNLDVIPITHGQFICCTDSQEIFIDNELNERIILGDIVLLDTEEDRESILVPLINKLYVVKESSKIYRYTGTEWSCLSNNTSIYLVKNTVTITENTPNIPIGIPGFDKTKDSMMVFINSVFLNEGTDYTIDTASKNILPPTTETNWTASVDIPSVFNFIIFKNISYSNLNAVENHNEELVSEMSNIKKENAIMLYMMMVNNIDVSMLLNYDKFIYLYKNNLWTPEMFDKAVELNKLSSEEYNKIKA